MLIGYARVSTDDQNLDLQKDPLSHVGCDRILEERLSGAKAERPGLKGALFGALAEFERNLIRERTSSGLQAARARGRKGGRPRSLDSDKRALAGRLYDEKEHTVDQICR